MRKFPPYFVEARMAREHFQKFNSQAWTDISVSPSTLLDPGNDTNFLNVDHAAVITIPVASLTTLGTFLIIYSYWRCANERNTVRQLLLGLSVADLLVSITNIIGSYKHMHLNKHSNVRQYTHSTLPPTRVSSSGFCNQDQMYGCMAESFLRTVSFMVTYFYTIVIASYFYIVAVWGEHGGVHKRLVWFHIACWSIPVGICIIALGYGALGPGVLLFTGPVCWINLCRGTNNEHILWMTFAGQGWLIVAYVICPLMYYFLWREVVRERRQQRRPFDQANRRLNPNRPKQYFRDEDVNYCITPIILYMLRIWGTIRYLMVVTQFAKDSLFEDSVAMQRFNIALFTLQCIGDNAQGFFHAIVFVFFDRTIRRKVFAFCYRERNYPRIDDHIPIDSSVAQY